MFYAASRSIADGMNLRVINIYIRQRCEFISIPLESADLVSREMIIQFILHMKFQYSFLITVLTSQFQSHCELDFVSPLQLDEVIVFCVNFRSGCEIEISKLRS